MTSKKYPTVRISPEAKEQLRKLSDENDIPMSKYLDQLLDVEDSETTTSYLDNVLPQDLLGGATIREVLTQHVEQNFEYIHATREKLTKLASVINTLSNEISTKPTKPPAAIIDASILYSFKKLGKKALTRKDIKSAVSTMMQESKYPTTWAAVYDRWFENHSRNKSKFELDLDNRLRRLVKDKLMSNEPKSGEYSHNLTTKHWEYVEQLATGFYPQPVMGKIVSITL